jgi:uncharacterized membrane protein YphA (DoxX/SURF4 family)
MIISFMRRLSIATGIILGVIFLTAGLAKLFSPAEGFKMIFNPFPGFLTTSFTRAVFNYLPFLEITIALLLIIGIMPRFAAAVSAVMITGFITNNAWLLSKGLGQKSCNCFGVLDSILWAKLSTTGSLYLDFIMLVMAIMVIFFHRDKFFQIRPRFLVKS